MSSNRVARLSLPLAIGLFWSLSAVLAAAPIRVTGRVQSERTGLSGARLELFPAYESYAEAVRRLMEKTGPVPLAKARTDAEGDFEILVPESGCYRVEVRAEGYLPMEIPITPLVGDLELPAAFLLTASPVEVRTVGPDGRSLPGIEVGVLHISPLGRELWEGNSRNWSPVPPRVTTDRTGRASLPSFKLYGPPIVAAASPRFLGQQTTGRPGEAVTFRLIPGRAGWIEARDSDSKPVPDALARWNGWPVGITGPDGRLEVAVPEGGDLTLESREGWGARVEPTGARGILPVRLEPPRRIAGRVLDSLSRRPVAGAVAWSGFPPVAPVVRSSPDGGFLLEVPATGEHWLKTGAAEYMPGERQLVKKGAAEPLVLTLSPSASIKGVVVDPAGRPVAGAAVRPGSVRSRPGISAPVHSRSDGSFQIHQLPPSGTFELAATHSNFARTTATARTSPAGQLSPPVRIVMQDGQIAFGRVVDEGGRPVAGAELTLRYGFQEQFQFQEQLQAVSDGEGRFEILHLNPGKASLLAKHRDHAPLVMGGVEIPSGTARFNLGTVKLLPAEVIEGRVTDSRGGPLAGAEVRVSTDRSNLAFGLEDWMYEVRREESPLRTGLDGSFRAERLEGGKRYNLEVRREGYSQVSVPGVQAPTVEPLRIEMKTARNLSGQVVGPEGEPVAGARLSSTEEIRRGSSASSRGMGLGTTDADGGFRVNAPPGSITLDIHAEGYARRRIEGLQIPEDKDLEDLRIVLQRGSLLEVRVVNAAGEPVPRVWVHAEREEHGEDNPDFLFNSGGMSHTDLAGRCQVTLPAAGTYRVHASASMGRASTDILVTAGLGTTPVEIRLPAGTEVSGRVIGEDGTAVAGASIRLQGQGTQGGISEPDGTFLFEDVRDGAYRLKATTKELTSNTLDIVVSGSPVQGLELRLDQPAERKATLTGRLLGLAPEEFPQIRVTVEQERGGHRSTRADHEGGYRIEGLEPGEWKVTARTSSNLEANGMVRLSAGSETTLDLEFQKGFTLTGRVLMDGKPLAGGNIEVWVQGRPTLRAPIVYDGSFVLRGLTEGTATLVLTSRQGFAGTQTLRVTGDQEVPVSLATGRLSGRVSAATGEPLEDARITVDAWIPDINDSISAPGGRTGLDGDFEIPGLGAGTYRIKVSKEGFAPAEATVEVRPGGSPPVAVVLKPQEGTS